MTNAVEANRPDGIRHYGYQKSIVGSLYFKIASGMCAYRTFLGSILPDYNMSAIAAYPYSITVTGEYDALFNIGKQFAIALLMMTLDGCHCTETVCDF